jgi:subtilase family serine protease
MRKSVVKCSVVAATLGLLGASGGFAAAPAAPVRAVDMGPFTQSAGNPTITVTVAMKLQNLDAAEALMQRLATPGDPLEGKFLTLAQVQAQFGPTSAEVQKVISALTAAGATVQRASTTTLSVTAPAATLEKMFQTSIHQFSMPATAKAPAFTFRAATSVAVAPAAISSSVQGVLGFSNAPVYHTNVRRATDISWGGAAVEHTTAPQSTTLASKFGDLTVLDFNGLYDVNPLLQEGITGAGRTIGIVTLASFTQDDAFVYWKSLGLKVNPNRISIVNVDGGPGAPSDVSGSDETAVDVEQSGGIAPGANIIVYQAPNTNQAFVDAFAKAVDDNIVDTMSTSFGQTEAFDDFALGGPVTDPFNGEMVSSLQAMHQEFVIAGLLGQSVSAAAGDSGAFDTVRSFGVGEGFTDPLTLDYPGSDSAITMAGGTTLPGPQSFSTPSGTVTVDNPVERVWGEDYLEPVCDALGITNFFTCGIFSEGTGGGVSSFFPITAIQAGLPGIQLSPPGQAFIETNVTPEMTIFTAPANAANRNGPDVEFNADPQTGYEVIYTSDGTDFAKGQDTITGFGGTSFVGPQLDGVTALLSEKARRRLGLLTVPLYALQRLGFSHGPAPVLHTISTGDNWFFQGRDGYSPAGGLGTLDVFNFSRVLAPSPFFR